MRGTPSRRYIVVANKFKKRRDDQPKGSAAKRVPDVVEQSKDWVIDHWLKRVEANAELISVSLSDAERRDHVPDLLDEAVARACGHRITVEERQKAAERHGTLRFHQGYSIPMLILEAHLLQVVIAECIRDNFAVVDLNTLIPDIAKISATVSAELEESSRAYMKQYEWHASRPDERPR
jgi:hypothetical protein